MGTWGVGLYQNDVSADVKDEYVSKLKAGKTDEAVLKEILDEYRAEREDIDCRCDFYLGLAAVMWEKGRLTAEIKEKALQLLGEDKQSERWEPASEKRKRVKILEKLEDKLNSEMPERKKIPIHKPFVSGWEEKGVYCFRIQEKIEGYEEYEGWYILFYIDRSFQQDWYVRGVFDEVAEAYFYLTPQKPDHADVIEHLEPLRFHNLGSRGNRYKKHILEQSKRKRPEDLVYLGKCDHFKEPVDCCKDAWEEFFWGSVDIRILLSAYVWENKGGA